MKIQLRQNHLLIEVEGFQNKGVYLTPEAVEKAAREATYGRVINTGPDATIKIGEYVLYKQYVGNELKHSQLDKDRHYIVVAEDDILAIVPEDKNRNEKVPTIDLGGDGNTQPIKHNTTRNK